MVQQTIHECAARVSSPGVHDQSGPFVNDQQIIVLVDDVQPDRLRRGADLGLGSGLQRDHLSPGDRISRSLRPAVDSNGTCQQPLFQATA